MMHGKDYVSSPEDDLLYRKCDLFEVSMITYDADEFPNNHVLPQY